MADPIKPNDNNRLREATLSSAYDKAKNLEADLQQYKTQLQKQFKLLQEQDLKYIQNLNYKVAKETNDYYETLTNKYAQRYSADVLKSAKMQLRIQKEALQEAHLFAQRLRTDDIKEQMNLNHQVKVQKIKDANELNTLAINNYKDQKQTEFENLNKLKQNKIDIATFDQELQRKQAEIDFDYVNLETTLRIKSLTDQYELRKKQLDLDQQSNLIEIQLANQQHEDNLDRINTEYKTKLKAIENERKAKTKSLKQSYKEEEALQKEIGQKMRAEGASELDIMKETKQISGGAIEEAIFSKDTASAVANNLINGIKQMFDNTIQTYGQYQQKINTRLQGSGKFWNGFFGVGGIESTLKLAVGSNPYVKLQAVMDNVVKATEAGIANNIEQRAFLQTVSESIATTFNAFDSNLLRVIRLQQEDSTAARLGLEAGLTNFFNKNFKDTAYLDNSFDTVSQNLIEATSQLSASQAVEVEYMVQKWLGSLYSVGFSDTAVSKISQALGYLGSGNISALSSDSEMQNLIVMAASRANMSYADLLLNGLDSSNTNSLLRSMVEYLGEIADSDNKVVKSEYAKVFGMTVSDLAAVKNLETDLNTITKSSMSYGQSINELYRQMTLLPTRISVAGMMQNLFDNVNYSIGTTIASDPVTYALWQITSMIEDLTGGIALPTFSVMGNMVDLNTTVTNLMRTGIVGAGTLGSIGSLISGLSSSVIPASMLAKLGILPGSFGNITDDYKRRGRGTSRTTRQIQEKSGSTLVGNTSSDDYYQSTLTSADEEVDKKAKQKQEESTDISLNNIHEYLISVFDPKMTEIERLVALMAGYQTNVKSWGDFKGGQVTKNYTGTKVEVVYPTDVNSTDKKTTSDLLASLNSTTLSIYTLFQNVVDGTQTLTVKNSIFGSDTTGQ